MHLQNANYKLLIGVTVGKAVINAQGLLCEFSSQVGHRRKNCFRFFHNS